MIFKFNKLNSGKHVIPINKKGYWESTTSYGHYFDQKLYNQFKKFISDNSIKTIVDFGCGTAEYVRKLSVDSKVICEAYDGNPHTTELSQNFGKVLDLSETFNLGKKFDCVISLEVGEHIPKIYERNFISNLINHASRFIILSWAIPNQPGDGHVNCVENDYIIKIMDNNNIRLNYKETENFRKNSELFWFKNTIMVFEI